MERFAQAYFKDQARRCLLVAGAGFNQGATEVARLLSDCCGNRLSALLIRENRPLTVPRLEAIADRHIDVMRGLVHQLEVASIDILTADNAVVGGRNAVKCVGERLGAEYTDVVIDIGALSIGTSFPIVRFLLEAASRGGAPRNVHVLFVSMPREVERRPRVSNDVVSIVHSFHGTLRLHSKSEGVRLWIPQLCVPKIAALERIYASLGCDEVCPIVPFPSKSPRAGDLVLEAFQEQIEQSWDVDGRNIVYAAEDDPLDVYRTILDIEEHRRAVFEDKSIVILSPVGSRAVAMGSLMAAMERDLPVVYVEALKYSALPEEEAMEKDAELLHVWLYGDAYSSAPMGPSP